MADPQQAEVLTATRAAGTLDGLAVGTCAAVAFALCAPCALHDESLAVLGLPGPPSPLSPTPAAAALRLAVAGFEAIGVHAHAAGHTILAAAAGLALVLAHATARSAGCSRRTALLVAALVATCPAVATAATTLHVHALHLLLANLALFAAASWARTPSWWHAAATGTSCGLAHFAGPTGALLAGLVLPWFLLEAPSTATHGAARRTAAVALAAGCWLGFAAVLSHGRLTAGLPTFAELAAYDLGTLAPLALREVGRAYLPLSVVAVFALWTQRAHAHALVLAAAASAHLLLACHLSASVGDDGATLLALATPLAIVTARVVPCAGCVALVALALATSGTKVALRGDWQPCAAFVAGLREAAGGKAFVVLTGPRRDEAFLLARWPDVDRIRIATTGATGPAEATASLVAELQRRSNLGTRLLLSEEAEATLRDPWFRARHAAAPELLRQLEAGFTWRPVQAQGFVGQELVPR